MALRYKLHQVFERFVLTDSTLNPKEHLLGLNVNENSEEFLTVIALKEITDYTSIEVIIAADTELNLEVKPLNIEVENFRALFRDYINSKKTQEECIGFIDGFNTCRDIAFSAKATFEIFKATFLRSQEINEGNLLEVFKDIIENLDLLQVVETPESYEVIIL